MKPILFFRDDDIVDLEYNCLVPEVGSTIYLRRWGSVKWRVLASKFVRNHVEVEVEWLT